MDTNHLNFTNFVNINSNFNKLANIYFVCWLFFSKSILSLCKEDMTCVFCFQHKLDWMFSFCFQFHLFLPFLVNTLPLLLLVYPNLINMVLLSLCTIVVYFNGIVSNILRLFTFSLFSYDSFANHCLSRVFYNKLYIKYSFITPSFQKLAFFLFSKMFVILAYLALLLFSIPFV